jgi:hypothetical protein
MKKNKILQLDKIKNQNAKGYIDPSDLSTETLQELQKLFGEPISLEVPIEVDGDFDEVVDDASEYMGHVELQNLEMRIGSRSICVTPRTAPWMPWEDMEETISEDLDWGRICAEYMACAAEAYYDSLEDR